MRKNQKSQQIKLALTGVLGVGLLVALCFPPASEDAITVQIQKPVPPPETSPASSQPTIQKAPATTPPQRDAKAITSAPLPVQTLEEIIASNPFAPLIVAEPQVPDQGIDDLEAMASIQEADSLAQEAELSPISATYVGKRGGAALLGKEIVRQGTQLADGTRVIAIVGGAMTVADELPSQVDP